MNGQLLKEGKMKFPRKFIDILRLVKKFTKELCSHADLRQTYPSWSVLSWARVLRIIFNSHGMSLDGTVSGV